MADDEMVELQKTMDDLYRAVESARQAHARLLSFGDEAQNDPTNDPDQLPQILELCERIVSNRQALLALAKEVTADEQRLQEILLQASGPEGVQPVTPLSGSAQPTNSSDASEGARPVTPLSGSAQSANSSDASEGARPVTPLSSSAQSANSSDASEGAQPVTPLSSSAQPTNSSDASDGASPISRVPLSGAAQPANSSEASISQ